jgi:heme/copper-type cytochrome/quinol oxidase subunit 2
MSFRTWLIVAATIGVVLALGALWLVLHRWSYAQTESWSEIKYRSTLRADLPIEVVGRRYEWRLRYPSSRRLQGEGQLAEDFAQEANANQEQPDDVHVANELHLWTGAKVQVHLKAHDVPHAFLVPNLRLRQDVIPGKVSSIWFMVTETNIVWDAEADNWKQSQDWQFVCGLHDQQGQSQMTGRLLVHKTKDDFLKWLRQAEAVRPQR